MSSEFPDHTESRRGAAQRPPPSPGLVTAVEPQVRDDSRVNIFVDGEFAIGLSAQLAMELQIRPGRCLTENDLESLLEEDRLGRALQVAVRFVSHAPRTKAEVVRRLERAGIAVDLQARVLDRLVDMRLLDDERYLGAYLESRIHNQGYGPRRVREELVRRGMAREEVENALALFLEDSVTLDIAEEQARRKWSKLVREGDGRKSRRKLFDFLIRRGFSSETARQAVSNVAGLGEETA